MRTVSCGSLYCDDKEDDPVIGATDKDVDRCIFIIFYLDFGFDPSLSFTIATLFNKEFVYFIFP